MLRRFPLGCSEHNSAPDNQCPHSRDAIDLVSDEKMTGHYGLIFHMYTKSYQRQFFRVGMDWMLGKHSQKFCGYEKSHILASKYRKRPASRKEFTEYCQLYKPYGRYCLYCNRLTCSCQDAGFKCYSKFRKCEIVILPIHYSLFLIPFKNRLYNLVKSEQVIVKK